MIAIPGHTEGSIAVYLPEHRALFTGDTIASFRRLAELDVDVACVGHEPILSGAGERLREVAATL